MPTPIEDAIRDKLTKAFAPRTLTIYNDSHKHSHHKAMTGVTSKETHFRIVVSSDKFNKMRTLERHRAVNTVLKEEFEGEGMLHALQIRALTIEEELQLEKKAKEMEAAENPT